ncbi:hypothetical protein MMC16_005091 [Acarospora aff. strigata]|nr:hypothetical protein [Acarospora aff. strigata]
MELELQELNRRLFNAKKRDMGTACVLLWCPPGGGKTHLARQYVFTHKKDFPGGIFWIDAKLRGDRFQGFWQVAQGAAMKGVQDPRQNKDKETAATFVDTVKKWFEARQDWLLVFDGITFDKDEDVTEFQKFIPDSKNSSIIYTSVDRTLVRKQRLLYPIAVKVRPLSEVDAMDLLYKGLGIRQPTVEQDEKARVLVRHLECLPLAIHAMAHRLSATRKAIEKYHIESYSTDFKLAEPYMGIMADLRKNNHPEALNLIHLLCFFGHNVPVAMLNLGRQVLKDANIYIKSSDRGSKRDVETTIGTLIKYGLIDRSLIRYDRIDRSTPDLSDGRQGSQDSVVSTLETIDIIKIHTIVQGFCCDSLREEGQFIYWLEIAVKVFCHSFDRADAHIRKQPTLGLVKDYREYETHGQRLLSHFAEKLAKTSSLRQTRTRLQRNLLRIEQEIQKRSPGSSQLSFRPQASIFDRTPSTSDDMPDTPRSTLSRVSTLGLGFEKPPVDSPVSIDGHCDQVVVASGDSEPQHTPEYPEDAGYATDQGELCASYPMTPTRSEDTARPHTTTDDDNGSGWQLVSNTRKFSKSKLSRSGQSGTGSIKRPRPRKDLGSFHPSVARTLVNTTPAVGSTSRPRSETRGRTLRSSEAINSLITIHHASPPPSREKENVPPRRLLSRPRASQTQTQVHINQPVLHEEGADQLLAEQDFFRDPPSAYSNAFPIVEDMQRGRSQESLRSRAGNAGRSPLAAEFVPQTRETQSASNEADPFSPPSGITSNHQTPKSSPGFVYANPRHSSDPYIAGPPPVLTVNEHDGAWSFFQPTAGRNPAPLPFEGGVSITAKRRLPADFRGHQPSGTYQPPRGPSTPRYLPQQAYQPPIYYSAPLPPGYSSQPMSRNPSGQSSQYPETEPPLFPSPFSPYLGAASTPMSPRDRLPDGCSPRKSPKVAHAFPAYYHHHDIFEPHLTHTGIDPRFTAENAIAGMGTWAAAEPISPLTPNANQYDISMSRSSSGPGIAIEGSGANTGPGIAQFQQAQGQLRFGQHEPFNIDEARQRTLEHARNLQLMAFEQGAFRPPHRDHRDRRSRWDYHLSTAAAVDTSTGTGTGTGPGLGLGLELTTGLTTAQPYPELNLIPTPSDELALQMQEFVSMSGEGRRRGLSAPMGRPDLDLDLNLSAGAYGVEFEGQG